jgi:hypothetical protein
MLVVELAKKRLDVEYFTQASIQLADAGFDFAAQILQRLDALQKLSAELLLRRLGRRPC